VGCAAIVIATRWPFRSHALFSWDSANFALALDKIDIAAHRPHPPGYLGYVFAGRALQHIFPDANTALVVWNMIATVLAVVAVAAFAYETADPDRRTMTSIAAVAILLTSPLIWFYGEVAEIYSSELLFAALIGYTAWRAARGSDRAIYLCVVILAVTVAFKVVTAMLMFPVVVFAWTRVSSTARRRSFIMVIVAAVLVVLVFLAVQPNLFTVASRLPASSDWVIWFLRTDAGNLPRILNRNLRNTLMAAVLALGVVNFVALAVWAVRDRRLPPGFQRGLAWSWLLPILLFCVVLVIAKPGYLLPFVPPAVIVVSGFYARQTRHVAIALIVTQLVVNVAHFMLARPASVATTGGTTPYRDKPFWQRMASDLQALTFPTRSTVDQSDARVQELRGLVASTCPNRGPVIVVELAPVDWRRVMFYFPAATAIHVTSAGVDFVGHETDFAAPPPDGVDIVTSCPVIWLSPDEGPGGVQQPAAAASVVPRLGWTTPPGRIHVAPTSVSPSSD
jgi:4-amino-4-deoxy-L-arabinose transferase-like glycosyltransferase